MMIGSTIALEEHSGRHPVHRETALLRQSLFSSASAAPDPAEVWGDRIFRLDSAPVDLAHGPMGIAAPDSLAALLGLAPAGDPSPECQPPVIESPDGSPAQASLEDAAEGDDMLDHAVQLQLQALVQAFQRRQRQASLIVACSVTTAFVLTLGGLILMFSMTGPAPGDREGASPKAGTPAAKAAHRADIAPALLAPIRVHANRSAKAAPLLIRAKAEPGVTSRDEVSPDTQVILAQPGRPLALGPLLPLGSASYLLLRGLPDDAALSAGRHTGTGTWMVKGEDVAGLTLTLGQSSRGDYPAEAYLLGAEDGPQARRRMVLRVDQTPQIYAAGLGLGWSMSFPKAPEQPGKTTEAAAASETPLAETDARTPHLPGAGGIAASRRLLTDLAERGQANAAYELALTYDAEVLAKAGLDSIDGDMEIAREWYTQAAQAGHARAAQRLGTLARRRAGA